MNKIENVEWYSIGGLCEKDLTGSGHFVVIKYKDKTKKIIQKEAGFWQKKETQHRNALFPEIIAEMAPGCIILSHEHLDHAGRVVPMQKALCEVHGLVGIPIIMSRASRELLPHVLRAMHAINEDSLSAFNHETAKFDAKWNIFEREYTRKPIRTIKSRNDHRPDGDRRAEIKRDNAKLIDGLKEAFMDWGGQIKGDELIIPPNVGKNSLSKLHEISREIKNLGRPENSGTLSTNESRLFENMKNALSSLFLEGSIFDDLDDLFSEELPRHDRKKRAERIEKAKNIIQEVITKKRKSLLPDIIDEDIDTCIKNSTGMALEEEFEIPGVPHVTGILHHAGHVLGSVSVELIFQMTGNRVKKLLFSGDIGSYNKPTLHGMPVLPQESVDRVIMESTYAGREHVNVAEEVDKIVKFIRTHRGPILMPVFAFDRLFVVLHALQEKILSGEIKCPIFCRNRLGDATKDIYERHYPQLAEVLSKVIMLSGKQGGSEVYDLMGSDQDCLILASGGTLIESSSAHGLLQYRAETGKPINMIFTGYQPGELGARIMNFVQDRTSPQKIEMDIGPFSAELDKDNILCTGIFSGHGDNGDLERFSHIGNEISLIHGDPKNAPILARKIGADIIEREKFIQIF